MSDTPEIDSTIVHRLCIHKRDGSIQHMELIDAEVTRKLQRERDEAREKYDTLAVENMLEVNKLCKERDEAREENKNLKLQLGLWEDGNLICEGTLGEIRLLEERIEEAQKELSSIHRWIDKNHADGFIDSLTYLQNLERVTDSWYDRIDGIEADARRFVRERDEARKHLRDANKGAEINAHINQKFAQQLIDAREVLSEIANASHFDNIGNWARNEAKKALEGAK
jgi:hypothetical protein